MIEQKGNKIMEQEKKMDLLRESEAVIEMAGFKSDHKYDDLFTEMLDGNKSVDEVIEEIKGDKND